MRLFNGTSSRVDIANESAFDFERTQPFSVGVWAYVAGNVGGAMVAKQAGSVNFEGWSLGLETFPGPSPTVFFNLRAGGGDQLLYYTADAKLPIGAWTHLLATYDGSSAVAGTEIYVNGVVPGGTKSNTDEDTLASSILNNLVAQIGCRGGSGSPAFFFTGMLREAAVWPSELTAADAALLAAGVDPALVGGYAGAPLIRNTSNPLIDNDASYDDQKAGPHSIIKMGPSDYRMWYEAIDDPSGDAKVALATSANGTSWTKSGSNPVMSFGVAWENNEVCPTTVLWDDAAGLFKMWYHGAGNGVARKIGYATSSDGVTWSKDAGNPILTDTAGWVGAGGIADCKVLRFSATDYRMWYRSVTNWQIGYATSTDGITWSKYGSNPVFDATVGWESEGIMAFAPMWDASLGIYHAWYCSNDTGSFGIGYASSPDGITWTRSASNPVYVESAGDRPTDSVDVYRDGAAMRVVYGMYDLAAGPPLRGIGEATVSSPRSVWTLGYVGGTEPDIADSNPGTHFNTTFVAEPRLVWDPFKHKKLVGV